jgi:hypothetical protein
MNTHDLNGIRTHDPSVPASEDSSYLRPRGDCDRLYYMFTYLKLKLFSFLPSHIIAAMVLPIIIILNALTVNVYILLIFIVDDKFEFC